MRNKFLIGGFSINTAIESGLWELGKMIKRRRGVEKSNSRSRNVRIELQQYPEF